MPMFWRFQHRKCGLDHRHNPGRYYFAKRIFFSQANRRKEIVGANRKQTGPSSALSKTPRTPPDQGSRLENNLGTKPVKNGLFSGLWHLVRARRAAAYRFDFHNSGTRGRAFKSPQARHSFSESIPETVHRGIAHEVSRSVEDWPPLIHFDSTKNMAGMPENDIRAHIDQRVSERDMFPWRDCTPIRPPMRGDSQQVLATFNTPTFFAAERK